MKELIAINGSPSKDKGNTGLVLNAFLEGVSENDCKTSIIYSHDLNIKLCTGEMHCWYKHPGKCYIRDDMDQVLPKLKQADTLLIATPIYIPLPGQLQIFLNRIVPLFLPKLKTKAGRTRATFHDDVNIKRILLITTGGWWEKKNSEVVVHIIKEIAENTNTEYSGAILRPHAFLMKNKGNLTVKGKSIIKSLKDLGQFFSINEKLDPGLVETISTPLISQAGLQKLYNNFID